MLKRSLTGYSPVTERVVFEQTIPGDKWNSLFLIMQSKECEDDPNLIYNYELTYDETRKIADLIGIVPDPRWDYFLECETN